MQNIKRKKSFFVNKQQTRVLLFIFASLMICYCSTVFWLRILFDKVTYALVNQIPMQNLHEFITEWTWFFGFFLWIIFIIFILYANLVTFRMFGSYNRLLREVEAVLKGTQKEPIRLREKDLFFQEMVDIVNNYKSERDRS